MGRREQPRRREGQKSHGVQGQVQLQCLEKELKNFWIRQIPQGRGMEYTDILKGLFGQPHEDTFFEDGV